MSPSRFRSARCWVAQRDAGGGDADVVEDSGEFSGRDDVPDDLFDDVRGADGLPQSGFRSVRGK